ncbi:MAG: type II toxin-antitoxin system HicB family antitoxin [Alphaproteobacteria bacterium]|nr:MAG: type II toxin-antitoxin system HicB family antitoxin [Alphaproteobacteria bacterium]
MSPLLYPALIRPLPEDGGVVYLATVPDLPGCMTDGETPEEALANVRDAIACWIEIAQELNRPVPPPSPVEPVT